jgi:hypothetical protein
MKRRRIFEPKIEKIAAVTCEVPIAERVNTHAFVSVSQSKHGIMTVISVSMSNLLLIPFRVIVVYNILIFSTHWPVNCAFLRLAAKKSKGRIPHCTIQEIGKKKIRTLYKCAFHPS